MKTLPICLLLLLLSLPGVLPRRAAAETVTTRTEELEGPLKKGGKLREKLPRLNQLVRDKQFGEAAKMAAELRRAFEATFDKNLSQYSFQAQEEYEEFRKTAKVRFEWIDWGYVMVIKAQAYAATENREFPKALSYLMEAAEIAPLSTWPACESGFILNQLGRCEEALASYRRALALTEKFDSQKPSRAIVYRGLGYAFVELQRLDEAEEAYGEALKLEPANALALRELDYIKKQRARQK